MKTFSPIVLSATILLCSGLGTAGEFSSEKGKHTHDGFLLRLAIGPSGQYSTSTNEGETLSISGGGLAFQLRIGGSVTRNLALHGDLIGHTAFNPTFTLNDVSESSSDVSTLLSAFGGGFTYFFMPVNMSISLVLGGANLSIDTGYLSVSTDTGFATALSITKEWWVSRNWGLGFGFEGIYAFIPSTEDAVFHSFAGALVFSATYN